VLTKAKLEAFKASVQRILDGTAGVIVGQKEVLQQIVIGFLCGGHVLLEGVPGLGKTLMARTLSSITSLTFRRIQFTPDTMPADILGTKILEQDPSGTQIIRFHPGPIFSNILLADEINRATPKTQSALLEAMEEYHVTPPGERETYRLDQPFFVIATQNPIEMEGTYPLPEAQIDRFFFKVKVEYPSPDQMKEIFGRTTTTDFSFPPPAIGGEDIISMQRFVREVTVSSDIIDYVVRIIQGTHPHAEENPLGEWKKYITLGSSPRGGRSVLLASKARALMSGRTNVAPPDVKRSVLPSLRHRIHLNLEAEVEGIDADMILGRLLDNIHP
jgi:MoxR-like ATPase